MSTVTPVPLGSIERAYADGYAAAQHEIERLRAALNEIASMADEDSEWAGRDKFRNVRAFAQRTLGLEK